MTAALLRDTFLKIFIASLLYCFIAILLVTPAFAQTNSSPSSTMNYEPITTNQYIPSQSPHTASVAIYNFSHALSCIAVGRSPISPCLQYNIFDNQKGVLGYFLTTPQTNNYGLLGFALSSIDTIYKFRPISSGEFLADLGSQVGLVKEAHAQVGGSGNRVLSGVFFLWEASRNFSYLAMILIFITIGVMVMFRHKLNPQTVVSIQTALPGLVIGLVLITFSYFLASLITDLSFIGTGIVSIYFQTAFGGDQTTLLKALEENNVVGIVSSFAGKFDSDSVGKTVNSLISSLSESPSHEGFWGIFFTPKRIVSIMLAAIYYQIGNSLGAGILGSLGSIAYSAAGIGATSALSAAAAAVAAGSTITLPAWIIPVAVGGLALTSLAGPISGAYLFSHAYLDPGWAASVLVNIILVFVILFALLRILIALLSAYLSLLVFTIISPFIFLYSAIPGNSAAASEWIRGMLANSLVFPGVLATIYFAAFLMGPNQIPAFNISAKDKNIVSNYTLPGLGLIDNSLLGRGMGIIVLLSASAIPGILKQSLAKGDKLGGAIEQSLNQSAAGGRGYGTALAAGIGTYAGSAAASHREWFGKPIDSSTTKKLSEILTPERIKEWPSFTRTFFTPESESTRKFQNVTRQGIPPNPPHQSTTFRDQRRENQRAMRRANPNRPNRAAPADPEPPNS